MFIFELTRTDKLENRWTEQALKGVVIAKSEKIARALFQNEAFGSFLWANDSNVQVTILGTSNVKTPRIVCKEIIEF